VNPVELDRALSKLRLSGVADVLETRLRQAQSGKLVPIDLVSALVSDELLRRQDRLFARYTKRARFRDLDRSLDSFDFNKKMNRALVYELSTARFIAQREDVLFLGPPGTGKSHLVQAIGRAAIQQGYRVFYREAHTLIEEIADATIGGTRKKYLADLATVPLLILDDLGMRKLPHTAAKDLLELVMRRCERASTILTSNRPVDDWGKLVGDTAVVTALLDRLLHHAHVLKCRPRSWRTKRHSDLRQDAAARQTITPSPKSSSGSCSLATSRLQHRTIFHGQRHVSPLLSRDPPG
jgi:DNA replication protein DnaC